MKKELPLRLLQPWRWLLVVLCFCYCCTAKHGTAIAFTNAAITSTRGGAHTLTPNAPTPYVTDNIDEIRYTTLSTQHAAATSAAQQKSKSGNDSSSDNVSTQQQEDPSKVRTLMFSVCYIFKYSWCTKQTDLTIFL